MGDQVGTKFFMIFASIFVLLVVILIVVAYVKGGDEIEQLRESGEDVDGGFFDRVLEGLDGNDAEHQSSDGSSSGGGGNEVQNQQEIIDECGDTNGDGVLDQVDIDAITSYSFGGEEIPAGVEVDLNADGAVDILDVVILTNHVIRGEPAPTCASNVIQKTYADLVCGDTNGDSILDQKDLDTVTSYAFQNVEIPRGVRADLNGDGVVDILDVSLMTNHVRRGAVAPTCGEVSNQAPIINSFTGPKYFRLSTLSPTMQVILNNNSWIVNASDPNGGSLNYNITWGDGGMNSYAKPNGGLLTIWHSYENSGKYTLSVIVKDSGGLSASVSKVIEIPYTTTPFFSDFSSNDSLGINAGDTIIARDSQGVLSGVSNEITSNGVFFIRTVGDDPLTSGIDEGASMGNTMKFYKDDKECVLVSGSGTWVDRGSKVITLNCS